MTNAAVVTCATGNASFRRCKGGTLLNKRSAGDSVRSSALVGRHQRGSAGRPRRVSHVVGAKSAFALNTANSSSSSARGALIQSGSRGVVHAATASKSSSPLGWCSGGSSGGRSSTSAVVVRAGAEPGSAAASPPPSSDENLGDTKSTSNSKGLPSWFPMHDFCLTLPWGLFVALGGVAGFAIAGSTKSLIFGGGFGALLMALGGLSLKKWKARGI